MIEPIKMAPCPFCEGPPCVEARDEHGTEMTNTRASRRTSGAMTVERRGRTSKP